MWMRAALIARILGADVRILGYADSVGIPIRVGVPRTQFCPRRHD